jgi:flavin-dependent dehydrogenase
LHFLKDTLPGYFWIFPLPNGEANVGLGIESNVVRRKKINLREVMLKAIAENPNISHRFKDATLEGKIQGWGLPMTGTKVQVSDEHFLLAGDAASLIDPFTGEGIGNALYSGMLAAEAAIEALQQQNYSAAFLKERYDDVLFKRIGKELQLSYKMQQLIRFPWLFNLIVNKAQKSPSLQATMTNMFTDLDMRALLKKPSFYWKILMNR